ncbi:MAG TPA: tetratricopeptide repeat protein [Humisphaera sp.]|nr:tetratricopeptide repeat protein [Humisphaera sp.]
MKKSNSHGVLLAAATAALLSLGWVNQAAAQYPAAGQDGHANDANNRVGSNGYNGNRGTGSAVSQENIVNRNVTGLAGFTGPIHERDPRAFTGPTGGGVANAFIRRSNGIASSSGPQSNYGQSQPYYSDNRFTPPPSGSIPIGFNGGYIGTTNNDPSSLSNGLNTTSLGATGLQARTENRDTLLLNAMLNPTGYSGLNSTVNEDAVLRAASFYGQRTLPAPGENANGLTPQFTSQIGIDDPSILRMRQELRDAIEPPGLNPAPKTNTPTPTQLQPNGQPAPVGLNQPLNGPLGQPLDAPANSPLAARLTSSQINNDPLSSTGIIPSNVRERPTLIPANMQSTLLDTLQQRLEKTTDVGKAMADARANSQQQPTPAAQIGRTPQTIVPGPVEEGPVKVSHLATGVKAKGLHDLLAGGEELITDGKYDLAIAKFNQAQRVAPNNPLPVLGRANAELAGGYYARAEQDLRLVFRTNRELLMAQFDLKSLFPKDREEYVRKDLNDLAAADPKAVRPWFLLAYLDYNTNKPASADIDLNEAEKRASPGDPSIRLLKQHWTLPSNPHPNRAAPRATTPAGQ